MRDCLNALCDIEMDMNRVDAYSAPLENIAIIQCIIEYKKIVLFAVLFMFTFLYSDISK